MNCRHEAMRHSLTIDVEDWFTGIPVSEGTEANLEKRLPRQMDNLLQLLDENATKGTFFWLGDLAVQYPDLVKTVYKSGHRIGCHGWRHTYANRTEPRKLRSELHRAKRLLEDISGNEVTSHRAPYFSLCRNSMWILDLLVELGFSIDSSIFPIRNWRYGFPGFPDQLQEVQTRAGKLWVAPVSVRRISGLTCPVSGGAYFRIFPYSVTSSNFKWLESKGRSSVFYLHPWELDPHQPRISFDQRARLTHYAFLSSCQYKFEKLLSEFSFQPIEETIADLEKQAMAPAEASSGNIQELKSSLHPQDEKLDYLASRRGSFQVECLQRFGTEDAVILDIGTRAGGLLGAIMEKVENPAAFFAMDIDAANLVSGKALTPAQAVAGNAEVLPFRDKSFDFIICTSTFKHIWNADAMLEEAQRVLKPGGILSIVDVTPFGIRLASLANRFQSGAVHRKLNLKQLSEMLNAAGFDVLNKQRFTFTPVRFPGAIQLEKLMAKIGMGGLMMYQSVVAEISLHD